MQSVPAKQFDAMVRKHNTKLKAAKRAKDKAAKAARKKNR